MTSRVNRFNYPNKTGGQCNKDGGWGGGLALCAVGGEIYAWLNLNPWRHKDEEKLLHNLGHLR